MSGIVAILNIADQPTEESLLSIMTMSMAYRGPDAQRTWWDGPVGLGHTMLRTTDEMVDEQEPLTFDHAVWIVADARVDDRRALMKSLEAKGYELQPRLTDTALLLHAYLAWGESCVEHLLGDFAFVVWDSTRRILFCARDQLGTKPFYYSAGQSTFLASNTLECLRLHPAVSSELDEQAVADFLLFGRRSTPELTIYRDIRRLPPAHALTLHVETKSMRLRRYWHVPVETPLHFRSREEASERFMELFRVAVDDRLRTDRVGIFLSGGMDSSSVAALAMERMTANHTDWHMRGYTSIYEALVPDQEGYFSGLTAAHLGLSHTKFRLDDYELFADPSLGPLHTPEPSDGPLVATWLDLCRRIAEDQYRVTLGGDGGDGLFFPSQVSFFTMMGKIGASQMIQGALWSWRATGKVPPLYLKSSFKSRFERGKLNAFPDFPPWVNRDFARRNDLLQRWAAYWKPAQPATTHPTRPQAYQVLSRDWSDYLESSDPASTMQPIEVRNPLFDLRLIALALRIPSLPYTVDKYLLRTTMRDRLPVEVLHRPKTPVSVDPVLTRVASGRIGKMLELRGKAAQLDRGFVDWPRYDSLLDASLVATVDRGLLMRPLALIQWLSQEGT